MAELIWECICECGFQFWIQESKSGITFDKEPDVMEVCLVCPSCESMWDWTTTGSSISLNGR